MMHMMRGKVPGVSRLFKGRGINVNSIIIAHESHLKALNQSRAFSVSQITPVSHKLTYSYEERNSLLSARDASLNYPLIESVLDSTLSKSTPAQIIAGFNHIEHTPLPETEKVQTSGRIQSIRRAGKGLMFLDISYEDYSLQVVVNEKKFGPFTPVEQETHLLLRKGDSVNVVGHPWRTKAGQLSILASGAVKLVSPCLHPLPGEEAGIAVRQHNRVAELKAFKESRDVLIARDSVVAAVQNFLRAKGFIQVQTPILSSQRGGANADPFITKEDLALRIAPELWLKRLIIGGFEKVFELGPSFRNEGIDNTHNPEFTTCEFYTTFASLQDLIDLTKELVVFVCQELDRTCPQYQVHTKSLLASEWKQVDFISEIEHRTGKLLPDNLDLPSLQQYVGDLGLPTSGSVSKLLDRLAGEYIEPFCKEPTFLINQPQVMAPLAKETVMVINGKERRVSRRFELLIHGREYANAYEEENDPAQQLRKLEDSAKEQGLAQVPDLSYVEAMEWGLPPTAGWGMGIDRLVMLLTDSGRIHDVLTFGGIKQVEHQ